MDKRKVFMLGIIIGSFLTTVVMVFGMKVNQTGMMIFGCVVFFVAFILSAPFVRWLDK